MSACCLAYHALGKMGRLSVVHTLRKAGQVSHFSEGVGEVEVALADIGVAHVLRLLLKFASPLCVMFWPEHHRTHSRTSPHPLMYAI
jgi:hypothetical protein